MLRFISIDNYTLIDHLEMEFLPGLNLITGETGSGKSILVDAVGLLVGARASLEMVREGCDRASIEGIFSVASDNPVWQIQDETVVDSDDGELIVRREISLTGTNRVFINGRLSTLNHLFNLGSFLVHIHGQHEQQGLLQPVNHLDYLDEFGGNQKLRDEVSRMFQSLQEFQSRIRMIQSSERERLQRRDLLQFQLEEIESLQLEAGLDGRLSAEKLLLSSAEKRSQAARESYDALYEREASILTMLGQVLKKISGLAEMDESLLGASQKMQDLVFQLEEIAFQTRDYADSIEFSSARLEQVEERLAEIEKAKRKYGATVEGILGYAEQAELEACQLEQQETELDELLSEVGRLERSFHRTAKELSEKRTKDAVQLSARIEGELEDLAMQETRFEVRLVQNEKLASEKGIDVVEFLISPNPGEPLRPLAKIASGGELSRIMLALKSVLKTDQASRTLVFDEIDAGIGGRVAKRLGEKLSGLASGNQVFCVTHLPQIAALATQHFHVGKRKKGTRTIIELVNLDQQGRVEELSRMLAGDAITATTRRQALELMNKLQR